MTALRQRMLEDYIRAIYLLLLSTKPARNDAMSP